MEGGSTRTNTFRYTPFGELDSGSQETVGSAPRWGGAQFDGSTGLYYMRARYYDSELQRFISEDPTGLRAGLNLFAFAHNDPINFRDPMGLMPDCDDERLRLASLWDRCWAKELFEQPVTPFGTGNITHGDVRASYRYWNPQVQGFVMGRLVTQGMVALGFDIDTNAFRHLFASCALTLMHGEDAARAVTEAHERGTDDPADTQEDRDNNEAGIAAGNDARHLDDCRRFAEENSRKGPK
jgi:RHS repeat-associated protein